MSSLLLCRSRGSLARYSASFPMVSLSYVFSLLIGLLVFRDQIGWMRVVGVGLICVGVVLVAQS